MNFRIFAPWVKPDAHSNFSRIFWNLSCSESESSWSKLGLDKRKLKTIDKHLRTHQKREIFEPKKSRLLSPRLATAVEQYCSRRNRYLQNRFYKPCYFEHCAQRKTQREIQVSDPHHVANFMEFRIFAPWGKPESHSNFWLRIFLDLSCSESESSWSKLGLDKRKLKTIDKHSRTYQKREIFEPKKSRLILPRFATTGKTILL